MYAYQGFWDRIAKSYANNPIKNQQAFNTMLGNIRKHVKESDTVLDFGCGTGTYSIAIADNVRSIRATDISENMLAIARQRANDSGISNIQFEQLEIFDSTLQPESFNVVLAFNILHLQPNMESVLERIRELLTPGGLLISKTVCLKGKLSLVPFLMRPFSKLGLLPHVNCISFEQLQHTFSQHQFTILETSENYKGSMEYFIVARK